MSGLTREDIEKLTMQDLSTIRRGLEAQLSSINAFILRRQAHDSLFAAARGESAEPGADKVVGVKEAARRLGTSVDSVYRKHKRLRLGYVDPMDGRLKFSEAELAEYVRRQQRR